MLYFFLPPLPRCAPLVFPFSGRQRQVCRSGFLDLGSNGKHITVVGAPLRPEANAWLSGEKELAAFLNSIGCGGGSLRKQNTNYIVVSFRRLEHEATYEAMPAVSNRYSRSILSFKHFAADVTLVVPGNGKKTLKLKFARLDQSQLDRLLTLHDANGLWPCDTDPPEPGQPLPLLFTVQELKANAEYVMALVGEPLRKQVKNLQGSQERRLQGHEVATLAALLSIARDSYPGLASKPLQHQVYRSDASGEEMVEVDASVVVQDACGPGMDMLLLADHKQTASVQALAETSTKLDKIRLAKPQCKALATELRNVSKVKVYMAADTWVAADAWDDAPVFSQKAILKLANRLGIHMLMKSGAEYALAAPSGAQHVLDMAEP